LRSVCISEEKKQQLFLTTKELKYSQMEPPQLHLEPTLPL